MFSAKLDRVLRILKLESQIIDSRVNTIREIADSINAFLPDDLIYWYAQSHQGFPEKYLRDHTQTWAVLWDALEIERMLLPENIVEVRGIRLIRLFWDTYSGFNIVLPIDEEGINSSSRRVDT